jgi:4-amino-4-deoxy-L-arabinose transferase-like glycosyltransferase
MGLSIALRRPTPKLRRMADRDPRVRFRWQLATIALVGFALRLAWILVTRRHIQFSGDAGFYHDAANLLADGKWFVSPLFPHRHVEAADHPPLYTVWLAIPSLVGLRSQLDHLIWSTVLGTGSIVVVGLTGREIGGRRIGLVAAFLAAVYPGMWVPDGSLMAETVAIFTTAGALLFAYRYWHRPRIGNLALVGVASGLGSLSRSELILIVPFMIVPLAVLVPGIGRAARWKGIVAGAVAALLVITPWAIYNFTRFEKPEVLSTQFGLALSSANCDDIWNGSIKTYFSIKCAYELDSTLPKSYDQSQYDAAHRTDAWRYVRAHSDQLPGIVAARLAAIVGLYHPQEQIRIDGFIEGRGIDVARAAMYSFYLLALLSIGGAIVLRRRRTVPVFPLLVPPVMVLITAAVVYASTRFRASAEVSVCLLAAIAIDALVVRIRSEAPADAARGSAKELDCGPESDDNPGSMNRTADLLVVIT